MTRLVIALTVLASLYPAAPADAVDEASYIDVCRDFSLIAKEVMTARQESVPMSETLPYAIAQIKIWLDKYGYQLGSKGVEDAAANLVISAYDGAVYPSEKLWDETRQQVISNFENLHFAECYKGLTSD